MTRTSQFQLSFNALGELTCAACYTPTARTQYAYDGLCQRVWSQKGTAPKTYEFHSQDGKLLMEWQPGGPGFLREHIYAGPRRIAEVHTPAGQAAQVTHAHPDPAGSPALTTDASGLVASREQYRPYGGKLISPNSNDSAGFAGKPFDAATGLSYMSARYYNPTLGRFISPDPVHFVEGNIHSFNRYAYANNNPMRYIDPTGLLADAISDSSETDQTDKSDKVGKSVEPPEQQVAMLGKFLGTVGRALGIGVAKQGAKETAYEAAKKGGRHAGQLKSFEKQTTKELDKSIKSFDKNIDDHTKWVADPKSKVADFEKLTPEHQKNLTHHWTQDAERARELRSIAVDVIKGR